MLSKGKPEPRGKNSITDMISDSPALSYGRMIMDIPPITRLSTFTVGEIVYETPIDISNDERNKLLEADWSSDKEMET